MKLVFLLIIALSFVACTPTEYAAGDLGTCYRDLNNAFCVIKTPPGTAIVVGTPPATVIHGAVSSAIAGVGMAIPLAAAVRSAH